MNRESSYVNSLKRLRYLTGGSPVLLVFSAWASYVGPVSTESEFRCVGWVVVGGRELLSSAVWSLVYKQTQGQVQQWQWHCISLLSHSPLQLNRVLHTCLHASIVSVSSVLVYNEKVYCLKYIVLNGASLNTCLLISNFKMLLTSWLNLTSYCLGINFLWFYGKVKYL